MTKLITKTIPFREQLVRARADVSVAASYADVIDATVDAPETRPNLFRIGLPQLLAWDAVLSLAVDPSGVVLAGAHAVIDRRNAALQGVVTAPAARRNGLATRVVAKLIVAVHERYGVTAFNATVRLLGNDEPNRLVWSLFKRLGFVPREPETIAIRGSELDAHLDDGSGTFRAVALNAGIAAVETAREILRVERY
jgi:ribosomal protein S18 acetylase RimI-like enzyme